MDKACHWARCVGVVCVVAVVAVVGVGVGVCGKALAHRLTQQGGPMRARRADFADVSRLPAKLCRFADSVLPYWARGLSKIYRLS